MSNRSFYWKDYDGSSALYFGDKYIASIHTNREFQLSLRVEQTIYSGERLLASNLDEAKQKAIEIIAFEYDKVIARASAKLEEYQVLENGLIEFQYAEALKRDVPSLDDTIKDAKEMGAAKPEVHKDKVKESSLDEVR